MGKWQVTEVQRHLKGADYPASGADLADLAERNGADADLVEELRSIHGDVDGPNAVMEHFSGELGGPTGGAQDRSPRDLEGPHWQVDDVQSALRGADYPAAGDERADLARSNGADDALVDALADIGAAEGPPDVMKALRSRLGGPDESA